MRFAPALALLVLTGCQPTIYCNCETAPDLRLITQQAGQLVSLADGARVELEPMTAGCWKNAKLGLQNVGLNSARIRVSTTSTEVEVMNAPQSLSPGENDEIELTLKPLDSPQTTLEVPLTIEIEGHQSIHFVLTALLLSAEWDVPRRIDFGGVEIGATRTIGNSRITGLCGDFMEQSDGELQFSPRTLGPQRIEARRTAFLHCPFISQVTLLGDGVVSALTGPAEVEFGDVAVGANAEREVVLVNYSYDPLTTQLGSGFTLVSATSPDVASRPALDLEPASVTLRVRFTPSSAGATTQNLAVTAGAKTLLIPLRGNGVP